MAKTVSKTEQDDVTIVDINQIFGALWRGKWIMMFTTAVMGAGAAYLALSLPDQFTASSRLLVNPDRGQRVGIQSLDIAAPTNEFLVESKSYLINSNRVLERVVETLSLDTLEGFADNPAESEQFSGLGLDADYLTTRLAMKKLNEVLTVRPAGTSYTITVSATTENPSLSADIANAVAQEFVLQEKQAKVAEAQEINSWLLSRLDSLQERVAASSRKLEEFRLEAGDLTTERMRDLNRLVERLRREQASGSTSAVALAQIEETELELLEMTQGIVEIRELNRQADADRSLYEQLLQRALETQELETLQRADTQVVSDALPPLAKSGPPRKLIAILGAFLGALLGIGLLILRALTRPNGQRV